MKINQITDTYAITVTEISHDADSFEISFETTLTPAYIRTTPAFIDAAAYGDTDDFDLTDDTVYELNVASRHDDCLYFIIQHDYSGDFIDDIDAAISQFGQPIIDFIDGICGLLGIAFIPNR